MQDKYNKHKHQYTVSGIFVQVVSLNSSKHLNIGIFDVHESMREIVNILYEIMQNMVHWFCNSNANTLT